MTVALVLVSHSERLAEGLAELAGQMAPDVRVVAAGGLEDGGVGTSYDRVESALRGVLDAGPDVRVVVLGDLGSAVLTVESVLEIEEELAARTALVAGPFVEGAVAAAVAAQGGRSAEDVAAAVRAAGAGFAEGAGSAAGAGPAEGCASAGSGAEPAAGAGESATDVVERTAVVRNRLGLHARPAAELARLAAGLGTAVTIGPPGGPAADATSVLAILQLGATGGTSLVVRGAGPAAAADVQQVVDAVESGFGED
ncbi:phosphocarrier protein HPr /dihydroxyacetone kinase DhaM subunit [Sediminihabitans luteus]|uniref:Phosphocarrier protein HPr n=1 Tax=Sediminihabitans luteus TaxID=1138585 RepID=A0A2M9CCD4_9CELL|nr:dihydroxyacetone kinase phosphoryl donor subunit DhaM [Sediminihabitans luteus]PJJ68971.1 phosphocarrier protein HPr /dihydroxyacetone kinase DhaM subunit [Sediminihabitans luteus]GII99354.1 PTS sugar transporter subunit IIA [Sediminihabitans luteus]